MAWNESSICQWRALGITLNNIVDPFLTSSLVVDLNDYYFYNILMDGKGNFVTQGYTQHGVVWENYRAGNVVLNDPKNVGEAIASARLFGEVECDEGK